MHLLPTGEAAGVRVLISRQGSALRLITHPDHGRLAGMLCEQWGNSAFASPAHRDALLTAATYHDDGWSELDGRPMFNAEAGRPAHFLEVPLPETIAPYRTGVEEVYRRDMLAGALVSMHWAGLYRTRWGLQDGEPVGHPATDDIVSEQEQRWGRALGETWGLRGRRSAFEADAWHAYEILQALDFISLAICLIDPEALSQEPGAGSVGPPVPTTLRSIDQPPGGRTIPSVPVRCGGPYVDIALWVSEPMTVTLDPYPFADRAGLAVEVPARTIADDRHPSAEACADALRAAPAQRVALRVVPR
ncbi:MAG: DUF3891 family protein [Solirubrobacteraceae bacterium]